MDINERIILKETKILQEEMHKFMELAKLDNPALDYQSMLAVFMLKEIATLRIENEKLRHIIKINNVLGDDDDN